MQEHGVTIVERKPQLVELTDVAIETISHNISQAEKLVSGVLVKGIDYGTIPGVQGAGLWDPGSSKIINAFNSYPDYKVLHHVEEDSLISYTIQALLVNRESQRVVGSGVGAASTKEVKYKYRWVPDPRNYGYTEEQIRTLKSKDGRYRITNPEYGELVNTMVKMACKRAEVDAAQSLPGVGSALRKLFPGQTVNSGKAPPPNWNAFWSQISALGLEEDEVHSMLGVESIKEWLDAGKTLNQAIEILSKKLAGRKTPPPPPPAPEADVVTPRDPSAIQNFGDLYTACQEDFGIVRQTVWAELNVGSQKEITQTPEECYRIIATARMR